MPEAHGTESATLLSLILEKGRPFVFAELAKLLNLRGSRLRVAYLHVDRDYDVQ